MNFSIFRFGLKLAFKSVYVYHLVLLTYMVLAQDNTSLTNLRMLLLMGETGVALCFLEFSWCSLGCGEMLPHNDFFSVRFCLVKF